MALFRARGGRCGGMGGGSSAPQRGGRMLQRQRISGGSGAFRGGGKAKRGREGGRATDNRNVRMSARDLAIQKQPVPEDYLLEFVFSRESHVDAMRFCAHCLHLGRYNVTIITGQEIRLRPDATHTSYHIPFDSSSHFRQYDDLYSRVSHTPEVPLSWTKNLYSGHQQPVASQKRNAR